MADVLLGCDDTEAQGIYLRPVVAVRYLFVPSDTVTQPLFLVVQISDACFCLCAGLEASWVLLVAPDASVELLLAEDASVTLDVGSDGDTPDFVLDIGPDAALELDMEREC